MRPKEVIGKGIDDPWKKHIDDVVIKNHSEGYVIRLCPHEREVYIQTSSIAYVSNDGRTYYMTSGGKITASELPAIIEGADAELIEKFWKELGVR